MPTTSPNMSIVVPVPLKETGPTYATQLQTALLTTVDAHDHSSGKGVPVTPAGLSINADLPFGSNNATGLRAVRLVNNVTQPALGGDVTEVYAFAGDLYYNNASGTAVRLTTGASVVAVSALTAPVAGTTRTISSLYTVDSISADYTLFCDTSGAAFTVILPNATNGRELVFIDSKGTFGSNPLNLSGAGKINGLSAQRLLSGAWGMYRAISNGTDWWVGGV